MLRWSRLVRRRARARVAAIAARAGTDDRDPIRGRAETLSGVPRRQGPPGRHPPGSQSAPPRERTLPPAAKPSICTKTRQKMDRRQLLAAGVVAGMAAGVSSSKADDGKSHDIVGSWFGTVTATNPPLGQFNDLISFHTGGVVIESRRYFV